MYKVRRAIVAGVLSIAAVCQADQLTNGSFETGDFTGWTEYGTAAQTVFTAVWAASDGDGDQACDPPDVAVRGTVSITHNDPAGRTATDFHFYMYQNDRASVQVTGALSCVPNRFGLAGCDGRSGRLPSRSDS